MYNLDYYKDYIKDQLTVYGLLETELSDDSWAKIVEAAMQEVLRYYDQSGFISLPAAGCIDLAEVEKNYNIKISSVSCVYNTESVNGTISTGTVTMDPVWLGFWQTGYGNRITQWTYNYINYNTMLKMRQIIAGSDLDFREDPINRKLYINYANAMPTTITIEYVPRLQTVDEITGDYWVDILKRMSLAYAKIAIGRARTRFKQSNALWTDDGDTMLNEGNNELTALRERLQSHADFMYPVD